MTEVKRHKMALLTWGAVYPLVTLLSYALEPLLAAMPIPVKTLAVSALMVPGMVYILMPHATAHLAPWLRR